MARGGSRIVDDGAGGRPAADSMEARRAQARRRSRLRELRTVADVSAPPRVARGSPRGGPPPPHWWSPLRTGLNVFVT
jgi:hypothetical protein